MSQQVDITVKKKDETTDIVYSKVIPSSGDKSPGMWLSQSVGTAPAHKPKFTVVAQPNAQGTVRRVATRFEYPVLATASDGKVYVVNKYVHESTGYVPQSMLQADIDEGVAQGMNLLASSHVKTQFKESFASS